MAIERSPDPVRRTTLSPVAILRSVVLSAVVFILAVLTGALLSGAAAPADENRHAQTELAASTTTERSRDGVDTTFARSMVVSGTAALAVSVVGLVMVGRRRRLW